MKTIEILCKQYDEWEPEVQKVVLEKHRGINVEYDKWWDGEYDHWKEKLSEMGYNDVEIAHSGFWSQGDGASFTSNYVDVVKWLRIQNNPKYSRVLKLLENSVPSELEYSAKITRHSSHYVHERTVNLQLEWYPSKIYDLPNMMSLLQSIERDIDEDIIDQCRNIYRDLEQCYDSLTSDEEVAETLRINEYEMTETGKIY